MQTDREVFLIVDDDEILRTRLSRAFNDRGFHVLTAANYDEAISHFRRTKIDRAVFDLKMPGMNGLELLKAVHEISPETRIVVATGYGSIANAVEAMKLGASNYVTKPVDADEILAAFRPIEEITRYNHPDFSPPSLAEAEWEHIQKVLSECGGNISEAARLLDIPRRTLQRKLKKLPP